MKSLFLLTMLGFAAMSGAEAQVAAVAVNSAMPDPSRKTLVVDAACGQCQLGLPGKSCDLAIRMNDKAYFVEGTTIDSHGDAHAKVGFCNSVRRAEVQGAVVDNRFKATYFQLLPEPAKAK